MAFAIARLSVLRRAPAARAQPPIVSVTLSAALGAQPGGDAASQDLRPLLLPHEQVDSI